LKVGIIVGLRAEARIAWDLGGTVEIGGGTRAGAEAAAERLIARGVEALLSFGLAGGLDPALPPGALVIPRIVRAGGHDLLADAELISRLGGATCEMLCDSTQVVADAAAKRALFRTTGAAAVDLESGAVALAAERQGLPFAVLRAVCDPATRTLPPAAMIALDRSGGIRAARVAMSVLRAPAQIPALLALARDAALARRTLIRHLRLVGELQ
jgi:adenosylhomocysteine nucleosidase